MLEIFDDSKYGFTDSIIDDIKLDKNKFDYLLVIDYYLGKEGYSSLTLRLKNVKKLVFVMNYNNRLNEDFSDPYSAAHVLSGYTLAHISKKKKGDLCELLVESHLVLLQEHENDEPLISCLCEEVYVEK